MCVCLIPTPHTAHKPSIPRTWAVCHVLRSLVLAEVLVQAQIPQHISNSYGCQEASLHSISEYFLDRLFLIKCQVWIRINHVTGLAGVHLCIAVWPQFTRWHLGALSALIALEGALGQRRRWFKKKKKREERGEKPNPLPKPNPKMGDQDLSLNFWKTVLHSWV